MLSYIIKRILSLIPTLFVVSVVVFLVVYMIPGGPATALLGMEATPEAIADLNAELGFDRPFFVQYADWFINMLHGDWGQSYFLQTTVLDAIGEYFAPTFSLAVFAQLISLVIAVPLGILAAYRRGTCVDMITVSASLLGLAIPGSGPGRLYHPYVPLGYAGCIVYELHPYSPGKGPEGICCGPGLRTEKCRSHYIDGSRAVLWQSCNRNHCYRDTV